MNLTGWGRNTGQEAALATGEALQILAVIRAYPEHEMLRLFRDAFFPPDGEVNNNYTVQRYVRSAVTRGLRAPEAAASDLVRATLTLGLLPEGPRRMYRGIMLEGVVETVLGQRSSRVRPEAMFDGLDPSRYQHGKSTRGVDLAVDEAHLELYECKTTVLDVDQGDLDLVQDVAAAASADGRPCTPAFAGFFRQSGLQQILETLVIRTPIFCAGLDDLARLATYRATTVVAN